MAKTKTDFFIQTALLDKYIHSNPVSDLIAVKVVIQKLKQSEDLLRYFFSQSPSPEWAEFLLDYGIFQNPPQVKLVENGFQIPFWPQSNYLRDIAKSKPDVVVKVVQNICTNNPNIHADLVEALAQIPVDISIKTIPIIKGWLENEYIPHWNRLCEAVTLLLVKLMEGNHKSDGINLLDELIRPQTGLKVKAQNSFFGGTAKPRFDLSYFHPDFWKDTIPFIETIDHEAIFLCILRNFLLALRLEVPLENISEARYKGITNSWRSSIGDTSQDRFKQYKDILLEAARDSLTRLIENDFARGKVIIDVLLGQDQPILKRIAVFAIAINSKVFIDLTVELLMDISFIYLPDFHNDYFVLLQLGFPVLSEDSQNRIISLILKGPPSDEVQELAENFFRYYGEDIEDYKINYVNTWIRDRLWVIKPYLGTKETVILNDFLQKYGEPRHPEFLNYVSEAYLVKDESPLSIDNILSFEPEELLTYIKKWNPSESLRIAPIEISHRGFAKAIANAFFINPSFFDSILDRFAELPSPYISEIFSYAQSELKEGHIIPWKQLFVLIDIVVAISKTIKTAEENQRRINERLNVLWFIGTALEVSKDLTEEHINKMVNALLIFAYDYDPDDQKDNPPENYVGHNDPITLAINSVRPMALNSLLRIIQLGLKGKNEEDQRIKHSITFEKVRNVFDDKLDRKQEQSWAVHSIFGEWIHLLYQVDFEWLSKNLDNIFPENVESEKYFMSAWGSFIYHHRPHPKVFSVLLKKYIYAIKLLAGGKKLESIGGENNLLASHLIMDFFWRYYNLTILDESNLLGLFFSMCDKETTGSAIWALWRFTESAEGSDKIKYWPQIKDIWKWRTNEFILSGKSNEFFPEIQWFSYLLLEAPRGESIDKLYIFIEAMMTFIDRHVIWENIEKYLASQVETSPELVIKVYHQMHDIVTNPEFGAYNYGNASDKIISFGLKYNQSRKDTLAIIDKIGRTNQRYRSLYEKFS